MKNIHFSVLFLLQQAEDGNQHEWYKKMYNTIHKVHDGGKCIYEHFTQQRNGIETLKNFPFAFRLISSCLFHVMHEKRVFIYLFIFASFLLFSFQLIFGFLIFFLNKTNILMSFVNVLLFIFFYCFNSFIFLIMLTLMLRAQYCFYPFQKKKNKYKLNVSHVVFLSFFLFIPDGYVTVRYKTRRGDKYIYICTRFRCFHFA